MSYLKLGSHGVDVGTLQQILNNIKGASILNVDNVFGPITEKCVEDFQREKYLQVDGVVGPITTAALNSASASNIVLTPIVQTPPTGIVLYLHGVGVPGKDELFTKHQGLHPTPLQRDFVLSGIDVITSELTSKNYYIKELIINTHGVGAGFLKIEKSVSEPITISISNNSTLSYFKKLKPFFRKNSFISIYACLVANTHGWREGWTNLVHFYSSDLSRGHEKYGHGTYAMLQLARTVGVPVRGGFEMQSGASGKFVGPWVEVDPFRGTIVHEAEWVPIGEVINNSGTVQGILWVGSGLEWMLSKIID